MLTHSLLESSLAFAIDDMRTYVDELMVWATPKILCAVGLPRRRAEPSSMSSNLCRTFSPRQIQGSGGRSSCGLAHIREELCSSVVTSLMMRQDASGTLNQMLSASIMMLLTPFDGSFSMYL